VIALPLAAAAPPPGAQGLAAQGFLAAQGLAAQGFLAALLTFGAQGLTAQGFWDACLPFGAHGLVWARERLGRLKKRKLMKIAEQSPHMRTFVFLIRPPLKLRVF
jgi:hypothetical protein